MSMPAAEVEKPIFAAAESPVKTQRRHDLDWLRVIAIFLLLFYHCGMAFVAEWGWHIKNAETSNIFQEWMFFMSRWRMALLFLISGAGTWFVLKRATAGEYIGRRFLRLFIPLVFGMFVVVPPQIYMERLVQGVNYGSYLDFYPSVFSFRPYPEGNFSWHHLWFIAYLFLFSTLALPIFLFLRSDRGRALLNRIAENVNAPLLYCFGLPLALIFAGLIMKFPGPQNLINDWAMFLVYFTYFVYGFVFTMSAKFSEVLEQKRGLSLRLACLCYLVITYLRWNDVEPARGYSAPYLLYLGLLAFNTWFWVLTILGYGKRYLNRKNALLTYANEAIYPFYILHQTVIVVLVYYVVKTTDTILLKFLFLSAASFIVTVATYHFLVRPFTITRFLFGMKTGAQD
ncbi:MAG TPA: acyltransferase family protein [Verrucomicrobiae bacterium]